MEGVELEARDVDREDLGRRLRLWRVAQGLTQEEVGARIGASAASVGRVERGVESVLWPVVFAYATLAGEVAPPSTEVQVAPETQPEAGALVRRVPAVGGATEAPDRQGAVDPLLATLDVAREAYVEAKRAAVEVQKANARIDEMEAWQSEQVRRQREAEEALGRLEPPVAEAPDRTRRHDINELVRGYAHRHGSGAAFSNAWQKLYREFRYRHGIDLPARARGRGTNALDCAEEDGVMDELYAVAWVLFGDRREEGE